MRTLRIIFFLLAVCSAGNLLAQEDNGGGAVVIQQDQRLQNIVSGEAPVVERKSDNNNVQRKTQRVSDEKFNDFEKKIGTKKKMKGYRIQMYWGNSLRADQLHAQRLGEKVTGMCPELKIYVSFAQPHWRCRVGDFKKRDEAAKYLTKLRKIAPEAMIVRSEIYLYQE